MFIRGPQPESVIWHHFRSGADGFAFGERDGLYEAQLVSNADRTVELYLAILEHFAPAVTLRLDDWRSGQRWGAEALGLTDVRDAVARVKHALAAHAGTEVSVISAQEQATLTANLEIFVFADTDRWLYLLQGKGLRRLVSLRRRSWRLQRGEFGAADAAASAIAITVERLGLLPLTLEGA
jgi:hypothetical protein